MRVPCSTHVRCLACTWSPGPLPHPSSLPPPPTPYASLAHPPHMCTRLDHHVRQQQVRLNRDFCVYAYLGKDCVYLGQGTMGAILCVCVYLGQGTMGAILCVCVCVCVYLGQSMRHLGLHRVPFLPHSWRDRPPCWWYQRNSPYHMSPCHHG